MQDLKPPPRVVDPELLSELKELWREVGCALCARGTAGAPWSGGADVELHHIKNKPRDDVPWNIIGLGGDLLCGHHKDVTENRIRIERNERGILVWRDLRAGGALAQPVRFVHKYSMIPPPGALDRSSFGHGADSAGGAEANGAGSDAPATAALPQPDPPGVDADWSTSVDELVVTGSAAPTIGEGDDGSLTADAPLPVPASTDPVLGDMKPPHPDDSPETRMVQIRVRVTASKRLAMEAAILLLAALERRDHEALGVEWQDYYSSLGLEPSNVTKMLTAARTLGDQWGELHPSVREHVSIEQLYQASLLVTREKWDPERAMDAAVANPTSRLIAMRTGDEPAAKCKCKCPDCGAEVWHTRGAS